VKKAVFIAGLLFILSAACKGPLAKQDASEQAAGMTEAPAESGMAHMEVAKAGKAEVNVEPAEGGITVAELFKNKNNYSGKIVKIKGKVTKVNEGIMGKNWIHLQDGTEFEGEFDLTSTSDLLPEVETIITLEGTVSLDKDFGYGYTYKVMLEEAKIIK